MLTADDSQKGLIMKVIPESKYEYVGTCGKYHLFRCTLDHVSAEIICVEEARFLKKDGSNRFYNTIPQQEIVYDTKAFAV